MDLYSLTLSMTDDCNYDCIYCYQKKGKKYLDISNIEKSLDFFYPFFTEKCYINFYGGEPLLAFTQIRNAVSYVREMNKAKGNRQILFSMTTNGSLLNDDVLEFLNRHKFLLLLSFDGTAQDISRNKGSFERIVPIIKKLLVHPDIDLEINSVFTPETVGYLSKSVQFITSLEVPNICVVPCQVSRWDRSALVRLKKELGLVKKFMVAFYHAKGKIPVVNFRKARKKGIFSCHAAKDRFAMSPDGNIWGCHLFADFFCGKDGTEEYSKFCFGNLNGLVDDFDRVYPKIYSAYSHLRMDRFRTGTVSCADCDELRECSVCPIDNRTFGRSFEEIPPWNCEKNKIFRAVKREFWKEVITNKSS
jgi:sulfatase maturation enzyme AslB (radical SAM superfamily)